jgi:3-methyladenine DNA glycosylase AlkD
VDVSAIAARIDDGVRAAGETGRAEHEKRYLKSELRHYGAPVPEIRRIVRAALADVQGLRGEDVRALVEALWGRGVHDLRMAAVEILDLECDLLEPSDGELVERLIRESKTWALVDGLAANVAGSLVQWFPELEATLDRWAADDDFWVRRSALLALVRPLRRGEGDFERFARYADAMLDEREFFIRKAIGWVLRETGKSRPELVHAWLEPRAARASGVTIREAVKYLPEDERAKNIAAHRNGRSRIAR